MSRATHRFWLGLWVVSGLMALALVGCANPGMAPGAGPEDHRETLDSISKREATRSEDAGFFHTQLTHGSPHVRRAAIRALGRLQESSFCLVLCQQISRETSSGVLEELAFALGQIHNPEAFVPLAELAGHGNWRVRAKAVEAIGKLEDLDSVIPAGEDALEPLLSALEDEHQHVRGRAALALWRRNAARAIPDLIRHVTLDEHPEVRWRAAYALMRIDDAATLPPLRLLLEDPDPWVRTFAAWGMRSPVDPGSVAALGRLLEDSNSWWTARAQALVSLKELRTRKAEDVGPGEDLVDQAAIRRILFDHLAREKHPIANRALIEALAAGSGDIEQQHLERLIAHPTSSTVRRVALLGLGQVAGEKALPTLRKYLSDPDPWVRKSAIRALGACGGASSVDGLLVVLSKTVDPAVEVDVRVRAAAAEALAELNTPASWDLLKTVAAADPDLAVRGTAVYSICDEKPDGWPQVVASIYTASLEQEFWDLRQYVLKTLRDGDQPQILTPLARTALKDPVFAVRQLATEILGDQVPAISASKLPLEEPYRVLRRQDLRGGQNPLVTLETDRGDIVLELYLTEAPRHVSNFVHLAREGFYDGLPFHRVEPAFVIQGGDPRRSGWGDAGYFLPDEINPQPYLRGTLGMPKATKDDGSCQLFVTHLPTPHLDGRYTVFGRVVLGMDVVDRIEVGDLILGTRVDETRFREGTP